VIKAKKPVVDVDGSYLYRKQQRLCSSGVVSAALLLPAAPLIGWECVTSTNVAEMSTKIPRVMPGIWMLEL